MLINNIPFGADLGDILSELQLQLKANNIPLLQTMKDTPDNIMVSCPYHKGGQERRPSAGILKTDGTFHCFTCGETHTLQEVISYCFGHTDDIIGGFGWEWLLKNFLTVSVEERKSIDLDFSRNRPVDNVHNFVDESELDKYREYHPYMWKRKMTPEVVDIFDIGYDKKTDCITFPVRDIKGNCLFVARRSVKTKFFNYPSGVEKPVYGLYELTQAFTTYYDDVHGSATVNNYAWMQKTFDEIIICESMIDAITCWVYGKYAVALNGLGNDLQFRQLNGMPCRKFILATDNDEAGKKARKRLRTYIKNKIITEYVFPPGKKDINDLSFEEFTNLREIF
jgi:DNA primase